MKGDFTRRTFNRAKHYSSVRMQQGRVQLDADWNEQMDIFDYRQQTQLADFLGTTGAPESNPGFQISIDNNTIKIGPGRYYVDGLLCENDAEISYDTQPDYPDADMPQSGETGPYIVYLDVWQRHVTAIEDPNLLEVALGGADTCTRVQNIAQVKLLRVLSNTTPDAAWSNFITTSAGKMKPILKPAHNLGNQLYRVEIHQGGTFSTATYKWSRDNGYVALAVSSFTTNASNSTGTISVHDANPSLINLLIESDYLELNSVERELSGKAGYFARITEISGSNITVTWIDDASSLNENHQLFIRRWESAPEQISGPHFDLENGLQVNFNTSGQYQVGQYWLIPARAANNSIEWPVDQTNLYIEEEPHGIQHHYARLALLNRDGSAVWSIPSNGDSRNIFPSLQNVDIPENSTRILQQGSLDTYKNNTVNLTDGVLVLDKARGLYRFDKNSTADSAGDDIILSTDASTGRFFRIAPLQNDVRILRQGPITTYSTDTSQLNDGVLVLDKMQGFYRFDKSSTVAADGYDVILATPTGRFFRIAPLQNDVRILRQGSITTYSTDTSQLNDGVLVLDKMQGLYRFDKSSTVAADGYDVIPATPTGRFFRIAPLQNDVRILRQGPVETYLDETTQLNDGVLVLDKTKGLYRFQKNSVTTADGLNVLQSANPTINPGCFFRIAPIKYVPRVLDSVGDIDLLQSINTNQLDDGALIYVTSIGHYRLSKADMSSVDGYTVISPINNANDRWIRITKFAEGSIRVSEITSTYNLVASDIGTHLFFSGDTDITLNLPQKNVVALPAGFHCILSNSSLNAAKIFLRTENHDVIRGPNILFANEFAIINLQHSDTSQTWSVLKAGEADRKQAWPISLGSFYPAILGGGKIKQFNYDSKITSGTLTTIGSGRNNIRGFAFPPNALSFIHTLIKFPESINTNFFTVKLHFYSGLNPNAEITPEVQKDIFWGIDAVWHSVGSNLTAVEFPSQPPVGNVIHNVYYNKMYTTDEFPVTVYSTPNSHDFLELRICRLIEGTLAEQQLNTEILLVGVTLYVNKIAGYDI